MAKKVKEIKNMQAEHKSASKGVFMALLTAFFITAAVFAIYAVLITYTNVSESSMQTVVIITTLVSVITAGIMTARNVEKSGWIYGMGTGILYSVIMIAIGLTISPDINAGLSIKTFSTVLLSAAGGGIGGMIGINIRKQR